MPGIPAAHSRHPRRRMPVAHETTAHLLRFSGVRPPFASAPANATMLTMLTIEPFRALRYATTDPADAARLTSPAYDLIDPMARARLEESDPHNIVRLILPRRRPGRAGNGYADAADTLQSWRATGILRPDRTPAVYVYEMSDGDGVTTGVIATVPVVDPSDGAILPHEDTAEVIVQDRLELLRATQSNLEPVVVAYDPMPGSDPYGPITASAPLLDLAGADGVRHRLWRVDEPTAIAALQDAVRGRPAVIADGHHRYASYLLHRDEHRVRGIDTGPWERALAYLVPTTPGGLRVRAIHRVVPGLRLGTALEAARRAFRVRPVDADASSAEDLLATAGPGTFLLTDGTTWFVLDQADAALAAAAVGEDHSPAWRALDVALAHRLLIEDLWHIQPDPEHVVVAHDANLAVRLASEGGVALLLRPTPADRVLQVAASGDLMPRKSTLFVPKPRTGLVLRSYADD